MNLPEGGKAIISVRDRDKPRCVELARLLQKAGFELIATRGTARTLTEAGLEVQTVNKVQEGRPHLVDMIADGKIDFIANTTEGYQAIADSATIRLSAPGAGCTLRYDHALRFGDCRSHSFRPGTTGPPTSERAHKDTEPCIDTP